MGGGRLADGLYRALGPDSLTVVVNTADDFWLHGLRICPDLDTVMYTLAGLNDEAQGWGIRGETWAGMEMLARLGAPDWFKLGDRDLAVHIERTRRLREGEGLASVTAAFCAALGVRASLVPMCEEEVATVVHTAEGELDFQEYFVRRRQADTVTSLEFRGLAGAVACPAAGELTVLCPSNPFVSLGPILQLHKVTGPAVAVSPLVAGQAVKGPLGKMMASLGHEVSALGVARMYAGMVQTFVLDRRDAALAEAVEALGMRALVLDTLMDGPDGRKRLATEILEAL